jgi:methanogenic corrinoid protein MtbC1
LGNNLSNEYVIKALSVLETEVLSISCTLKEHVDDVKELITMVRGTGPLENIKVIVGGQAFSDDPLLWHKIGADAQGVTLEQTVHTIKYLDRVVSK